MQRPSKLAFDMTKIGDQIRITMNAFKAKNTNNNETLNSELQRRNDLNALLEPIVVKVSQDAEIGYSKSAALAAELSTMVEKWPFHDLYALLRNNNIVL